MCNLTKSGCGEDGSENPHPTEPHKVATLFKKHRDNGGRNVFQGMIPAVKFRDAGPGGRSHIVRQRTQSGVWVNRTLSESEVDRLFFDSEVPMWWGDDADIKRARQGNAGPPSIVKEVLRTVAAHFLPANPFVPTQCGEIISEEDVRAYRGSMAMAYFDYTKKKKEGSLNQTPGQEDQAAPRPKQMHKGVQPLGGLVFRTPRVPPMYLADFWETGNVDEIVPVESLRSVESIDRVAYQIIATGYPDREAVAAYAGGGVPSKDTPNTDKESSVTVLSTNHKASLNFHPFVDKMFMEEVRASRMCLFDMMHSPPIAPSYVTPVGAVCKKTREGKIDPTVMRPTADLSWPSTGYWMALLVRSPNASIDLERDFPYIFMITAANLIDQILFLRYRASPTGKQGVK